MRPVPDLSHILWLGGSSCAGKTAVARLLAAEHGLPLYACDEAFAEHRRRADPDRQPSFCRVGDLPAHELWGRSVEDQVSDLLVFYREEFPLIVEDLLALPADGPLLVEGTGLLPDEVAQLAPDPRRSLFLVATPGFRRRRYPQRGAWVAELLAQCERPEEAFERWMARDDALARFRRERIAARGQAEIVVDGERTIAETAAAAAQHFDLK
ncbi:MAG TPA: hypothetical protein VOA87_18655 [Thermoanaerobaculia bacterium]|nr:hypothetical protein [Thermoanaerobaculia bacterium]